MNISDLPKPPPPPAAPKPPPPPPLVPPLAPAPEPAPEPIAAPVASEPVALDADVHGRPVTFATDGVTDTYYTAGLSVGFPAGTPPEKAYDTLAAMAPDESASPDESA